MALEFSREKNPAPASDERRAEILADPGSYGQHRLER